MPNKNKKNIIHEKLSKYQSVDLKILLEEDDFSFGDEKEKSEPTTDSDEPVGDSPDSGEPVGNEPVGNEPVGDSPDSGDKDKEELGEEALEAQVEKLTDEISDLTAILKPVLGDEFGGEGEDQIISNLSAAVSNESIDYNVDQIIEETKSIMDLKKFLFEFQNTKLVSDEIEALNAILTKGNDIVNKFKKGKPINIASYVNAAINAYNNFDSLFSKELIVKQASIKLLILNSGERAEENIRKFEELYHEKLHKTAGIEYEEHALIVDPSNNAVGSKSQG